MTRRTRAGKREEHFSLNALQFAILFGTEAMSCRILQSLPEAAELDSISVHADSHPLLAQTSLLHVACARGFAELSAMMAELGARRDELDRHQLSPADCLCMASQRPLKLAWYFMDVSFWDRRAFNPFVSLLAAGALDTKDLRGGEGKKVENDQEVLQPVWKILQDAVRVQVMTVVEKQVLLKRCEDGLHSANLQKVDSGQASWMG
eukprot:763461-Hanusia_phi.AAC.2